MFPSSHSGVAVAIRENTFLPANVRRIYTPSVAMAGRVGVLKLVRGDAAFFDQESLPAAVPIEPARRSRLSEEVWKLPPRHSWMRHRHTWYMCFCWMPMVMSHTRDGPSRSPGTGELKNFYVLITCRPLTHTSQLERLSSALSPTLGSTSSVSHPRFKCLCNCEYFPTAL